MKKTVFILIFCGLLSGVFSSSALAAEADDENPDLAMSYDSVEPEGDVILQTLLLENVVDMDTALNAVSQQLQSMTAEQKVSSSNIDLATLYAETAISNAASRQVNGHEIIVSKSTVSSMANTAERTRVQISNEFEENDISPDREFLRTVTFSTEFEGEIAIRVDPDILKSDVDRVRVNAPDYSITLRISDMAADLETALVIWAENVGTEMEEGTGRRIPAVRLRMSREELITPVTLSFFTGSAEPTYMAVLESSGEASSSKYNPATARLDSRVNHEGLYSPANNMKDFTDISNKDAVMQKAIRELASRGIIKGTSETEFSPDRLLPRSHFVVLIMRGLGKVNNSDIPRFRDVTSSDWYYKELGSSQRLNFIQGYQDGCFHGDRLLNKTQIYGVAGRILKSEMGYREPDAAAVKTALSRYSDGDSISPALRSAVALSAKCGLVVPRKDGSFAGGGYMTRGNAAIVLYNLFRRIW